jgi:PAS domain S-box-containing protein
MNNARLTHRLATGAALVSAAIGLFVLMTWGFGSWRVATFGADYIPMAPITALLFVALGLVLGGRLHLPHTPRTAAAALIAVGLVALASALELVRTRVSFPLPWDRWGFGVETKFNLTEIGRMAPITAGSFLLAAAALAAEHPAFLRHRSFQWIGRKLSAAGMLIAGVVLLAYVAGEPLGYSPQSVPMALLTAVAFLVLQTGALLVSKATARAGAGATAPADRYFFGWGVTLAIATMLGGSFYGGYALLRNRQSAMRQTVQEQLQSIAELKVQEITQWRHERISDAQVTVATPGLAEFIAQLAENPAGAGPERAKMEALFASILQVYDNYRLIVLLDRTQSPVLVFPAKARWDDSLASATRRALATSRDVLLEDLHRGGDGHVHMDMIAPVLRPGSASFAGAVVLSIKAEQQLYPMVRHWPAPSATAETLIVRREGSEVVYLNELRHQPDSPLRLRRPVTDPQLLAAQALGQGKYGPVEGVDYRGHRVLGVALPVPGSDWVIIAKVDRDEAYEPIYVEGRQIILGLGLLGAVGLLFLRSWWQYRYHRQMETQLVAERATRTANERLALVMRHANDAILLFDDTQHIIESNDRAAALYGYPASELQRMTAAQLRAPAEQDTVNRDFSEALATTGIRFETKHRRKDGAVFPVEVSSRVVRVEGRRLVLSVIRDISERQAHEREIERVNRLYLVISKVNQALVRAKSRGELFQAVCSVLVEAGHFQIAWAGWVDATTNTIRPVAVAGDAHGYVAGLTISLDPALPAGRGPSATAFRDGRTYVCNDYFADPTTLPWREKAAGSGFKSALSLPFNCQGQPAGLLTVYATEVNFFTGREIELLEETATDVSFALDVFAGEAREREATAALLQREEIYATIFGQAMDAIALVDVTDGHFIEFNRAAHEGLGYTREEFAALGISDLQAEHTREQIHRNIALIMEQGSLTFETQHRQRNGRLREVRISAHRLTLHGHERIAAIWSDITEAKRLGEALRESEARFRDLFDLESDAIMLLDADTGRIVQANQAACTLYDCTAAELESLRNVDISAEPDATLTTARPENRKLGAVILIPHRLHRKRDGTLFPVEISLRFFERTGRTFYLAAIRDITLQVAARENLLRFNAELEARVRQRTLELATRTQQIEALLSAIPDTVIRLRTDGSVLHTQPAKDSPALAALTPGVGVVPAAAATALVAQSLSLGHRALAEVAPISHETEIATPGGPLAVELRTAPVGTDEFVVFARDISDRKRHETEAAAMLQKERALTEMKTRFISVTSHEFRTPMAAALGSVEILSHHLERLAPEKRTELLGRITTSLQRMTIMLDDILLLNRMDANRVEVQLASVDLRLQLASIVEEIRLGDKVDHSIKLELSGEIGRFVTDSSLLHHILANLLSNAVRYSPAGSVITLHGAMEARQLELVVEDQGIGIPADDQARIFEPFERGSNVGTIKGTGLGLSIVKRLIGLLGGTITLTSPAGGGCRFTLIFPVQLLPPPKS